VSRSTKKEERRSAEPSGNYCFEVHPGEYTISPVVSPEEQRAGLLFAPATSVVTIFSSPRLDVNFKQVSLLPHKALPHRDHLLLRTLMCYMQVLVTLSGVVRCIESPCDASISVVLSARDRPARVTTGLGIGITPLGKLSVLPLPFFPLIAPL